MSVLTNGTSSTAHSGSSVIINKSDHANKRVSFRVKLERSLLSQPEEMVIPGTRPPGSARVLWADIVCISVVDYLLYMGIKRSLPLHQPNCKTLRDLIWRDFSLSSSHLFFFFTCRFPNLTFQLFFKLQFTSHGFLFNELPTTHASVLTLLCSVQNETAGE